MWGRPAGFLSGSGAVLILISGCQSFTEHSGPPPGALIFINAETMEVEGTLDGIRGGASICAVGAHDLRVASTDGKLHFVNALSMSLDTTVTIGQPHSSGYGSMAYAPWKSSLYIIGAMGAVLEVGVDDGLLKDQLTVGYSPAMITASGSSEYLYVSDPAYSRIHSVNTESNLVHRNYNLSRPPTVFELGPSGEDTLLISTGSPGSFGYIQPCLDLYPRPVSLERASDMVRMPEAGLIFAAHPRPGEPGGTVSVIDTLFPFSVERTLFFTGSPTYLVVGGANPDLFILSITGTGGATLHRYDPSIEAAVSKVDLQCFPIGIAATENRVVIVTY